MSEEDRGEISPAEGPKREIDVVWLACSALVTILAVFLRFFALGLKPLHHDEGVNGFFLTTLFREGAYKYDPANYHGPTLYYISLAFTKLFGLETIPIRASVAIFGVLMVVLALFLRRYIGTIGSLMTALFLALSPGMVYISRYFIHEIFFVFLSLAVVVAVLFFIEKRKAGPFAVFWMGLILVVCFLPSALNLASFLGGTNSTAVWAFRAAFLLVEAALAYYVLRMLLAWDGGRPIYLLLASASVALMFATKETAFITLGTMLIACFCIWIWRGIRFGDAVEKNWFRVLVGIHAVLILAALWFSDRIVEGIKWLYSTFSGTTRPAEPFVFYSIVFLFLGTIAAWVLFLVDLKGNDQSDTAEPVDLTWNNFRKGLDSRTDLLLISAAAATVFIYLSVLFFSSFFTYAEGVSKAFEAYAIWTKTGSKDHTQNGLYAYLKWGMKVEAPIMILSALGAMIALITARHRFAMFAGLWAFGLFAAYSFIPYKTPWLTLSFLLPMCISAGYAINELALSKKIAPRLVGGALALSASALLAYQSYQHNFVRYDDEQMSYVYAHTRRGFLDLVREIEWYAEKSGKGKDATVEIVSPDYWPLTWYLNDFTHANFHGAMIDANTSEIIIAKKDAQDAAMIQKFATHYKYVGVYPLRPGVNLVLLVRKDLADSDAQDVYKVLEYRPIPGSTN
ncbi:MAG: glycosyltransferase family 39 protein [Pyrinomonadaceae bacterium]